MDADSIIARLRDSGFRVTPQRLTICEIVLSSKEHPTADQVYEKAKEKHPTISLATVYQTLHLLSENGLLQELGFGGFVSRYDPDALPHINVVCKKCGKIYDYRTEDVRRFWAQVVKGLGFKPVGQRIDVYTYCAHCMET